MKTVAVFGLTLLCMCQVESGKRDELHSFFKEKTKELKSEKLPEPAIFLAAATTPFCNCDAEAVVLNGTTFMKNTLDIVSGTFSAVYTLMYPSSGSETCTFTGTFGNFRCYLLQFNVLKDTIWDVKDKVVSYRSNAAETVSGISKYIKNCFGTKTV